MSLSMYQASVPVFVQVLTALSKVLDRAEAHATAKKIDPAVLLGCRLALDMYPLTRQVQTVCDMAKGGSARLAGVEVPSWPDKENTLAGLKDRIRKTLDFVQSFKPAQIDGSEAREITMKLGGNPVTFKGQDLSGAFRDAQSLLPRRRGLRHPAPQWRGARQARLPGPGARECRERNA